MALRFAGFALVLALSTACSSNGGEEPQKPATWAENVAPIVLTKCANCHRDGGIAPFPLENYAQVKAKAALVAGAVESKIMPPWGAYDSADCKHRLPFRDDLRLTDQEIKTITSWANNGAPEGDKSKTPAIKPTADGVLNGATSFSFPPRTVAPSPQDDLRCFPIDPGFTEDTWIDATHIVPGDPRVVHHVLVYTDPKSESVAKAGAEGSYECFGGPNVANADLLIAWAPGVQPMDFRGKAGFLLKAGSKIVVQMHYHPAEVSIADQTKVQLRKLGAKPEWNAQIALLGNIDKEAEGLEKGDGDRDGKAEFRIPAGVKGHVEKMGFTIPPEIDGKPLPELRLFGIGTHMHWVGKDMSINIKRLSVKGDEPDEECLIGTPQYNFNWQRSYTYAVDDFMKLPPLRFGDRLTMKCTYDNTMGNAYVVKALQEKKMSAPIDVFLGEATLDEMCLGAFVVLAKN